MSILTLTILDGIYTIHRFSPAKGVPPVIFTCPFYAITRTGDELSIVVPAEISLDSEKNNPNWTIFCLNGPFDLQQVGVLAGLSATLSQAKISLFTISTYDTDYLLIKSRRAAAARTAFENAGYIVLPPQKRKTASQSNPENRKQEIP